LTGYFPTEQRGFSGRNQSLELWVPVMRGSLIIIPLACYLELDAIEAPDYGSVAS
jgi:hypothetical protein